MSFLDLVKEFMAMGLDEDTACQEAYAEMYPESYDPTDYEQDFTIYTMPTKNLWVCISDKRRNRKEKENIS